jgi:hypothetical protein
LSGMFISENRYAQWFDPAIWERAAANFKLALDTLGAREYAIDFEPYWKGQPSYPTPGEDTTRCKAAMLPLIDAIRARGVRMYLIPGKGYAPCDAIGEAWPQSVFCSEFGYTLPSMAEPVWSVVDADLTKATADGRSAMAGFFSKALRAPTPKFLAGFRARGLNRFWIYAWDDDAAGRNFADRFFTRAWFDK